ncbi:MAG: FlgD immunoglobulin-like domain containing protein [Candidatus Cloacimonadaceae bacterium]|nr:FlgD immunoglobulin-like domain containing protein [Candidatus Cloacimonadaceae bacterium]
MKKCVRFGCLATIIFILFVSNAWAQSAVPHYPSTNPFGVFANSSFGRDIFLRSLTRQSFGGSWDDQEKCVVAYNAQGLCASFLTMSWNSTTQDWEYDCMKDLSYLSDNRLTHTELLFMIDGIWTPTQVTDWIYDAENMVLISNRAYQNGEEVPYYSVQFYYDPDSGRLDNVVETFFISPTFQPQNKFVYEWDAPGRLIAEQKYQRNSSDLAWVFDLRSEFTYLPEDQSTYAEQLRYLETHFSMIDSRYTDGRHPFLIDTHDYLFTPDEGIQWLDYFRMDYTYNPDLSLDKKQLILRYGGLNELQDETRYVYKDGLISTETYYQPVGNEGDLVPRTRWVYEFIDTSATDDQTAPSLLKAISVSPNPFIWQTSIGFSLEKGSNMRIDVYNLRGQIVRSIQNGFLASGKHQIAWDGKDDQGRSLSSGIYLLRLISENESKTIKAMIMK